MDTQARDGVALQLHACETLASNAAIQRVQEQLYDLLTQRLPVSITFTGLESTTAGETLFEQCCEVLSGAMQAAGTKPENVAIVIDAALLAPEFLWRVRCEKLGAGPLFLLVSNDLFRCDQDNFWLQCWRQRSNGFFRLALAPVVSSPCPLFALEVADAVLPPHDLQVPAGTAWVAMRINVMDFVDERGEINELALRECTRRCVEYGDKVHDDACWPNAAMRHDGWLNRRLAISIEGLGDLAFARNANPQSFSTLQDLGAVLREIRDTANEHSRRLASENEHAPALSLSAAGESDSGIINLAGWQARWQAALQFAATRHRNLIAMSPWSVFPAQASTDTRYSDLLPLLAQVDACSFPSPPSLATWNINEFKHFHGHLGAVLAQKEDQQMIAEQV